MIIDFLSVTFPISELAMNFDCIHRAMEGTVTSGWEAEGS